MTSFTNADGSLPVTLEASLSGGPPDVTGLPTQLTFALLRAVQGKARVSSAITATNSGDAQLKFSAAPKTLQPGQPILLTGGASAEVVFVSQFFVPLVTATAIPLAKSW